MDVRAEFEEFFRAAYPWLASQLHAITGDRVSASTAVETAFDGCWQRWAAVRRLTDPLNWVRWAALRAAAQGGGSGFGHRSAAPSIPTDTDVGVVLAALQTLPRSQRQAVVLHYMGDVPVEELARRGGTTADAVDWLLDTGFDTLVETLGWPVTETDQGDDTAGDADPRYDWTAEALSDTAMLLAGAVTVPDPSSVLQRAAVLRWAKRAAPIAVSAACVSSIVVLAAQLTPGGTDAPRTPTIYVARPDAGDEDSGYTQVRVPPVDDGRVTGAGVASPLPYLGMKILSVAQSTRLEDFGVSAPQPVDVAAITQGLASGSSSRAAAVTSTPGGSTVTLPATDGSQATPGTGLSGGTVPASPGTIPPTTSSVTIPPATTPPTTTPLPPVTTDPPVVIPTIDPPVVVPTIDPPVVVPTIDPPVVTITTEPAATTTPAVETTTAAPTTTEAAPTTAAQEEPTTSNGA